MLSSTLRVDLAGRIMRAAGRRARGVIVDIPKNRWNNKKIKYIRRVTEPLVAEYI